MSHVTRMTTPYNNGKAYPLVITIIAPHFRSFMKKLFTLLLIILIIAVITLATLFIRTWLYPFTKLTPYKTQAFTPPPQLDKYIARLSKGIQIPTISHINYTKTNFAPFIEFRAYLAEAYPTIFKHTEFKLINEHAMLFKWKGKNPSLKPILFNAHYDVVPAGIEEAFAEQEIPFEISQEVTDHPNEQANNWKYPPFSGAVNHGRIYGRGTIDMKGMLFALLDAAESLIESGFQPERDIYFAFGHDEEVGSRNGSEKIAQYLHEQGVLLDAVYDEGGILALSETNKNTFGMAFIGIAEKGLVTVKISVFADGGHSSSPSLVTALGSAAVIMQRLENNQMPARIIPETDMVFKTLMGNASLPARVLIANQDILKPLFISQLSKNAFINAVIRTTTALTRASGSDANNVLPSVATVVVNFRLQPGDRVEDVLQHVKKQCDGFEVKIETLSAREASNISPTNTHGYKKMVETIHQFYPTATLIPYISIGGTDARNYQLVSSNLYRFLPVAMTDAEKETMHNYDESITINNYARMILYFKFLMQHYDH